MFSGYSLLCRGNWPEAIYNISTFHVTPQISSAWNHGKHLKNIYNKQKSSVPIPVDGCHVASTLNLCVMI